MTSELREYISLIIERVVADHCRYERTVIKTLDAAGVRGHIRRANCVDSLAPDADMRIGDEIYYVEVKASSHARMGSTSMGYSVSDREFYPAGLNRELSTMVVDALNASRDTSLSKGIERLVKFLKTHSTVKTPVSNGFPLSGFTPESWEDARELGLIQAINRRFSSDVSIITNHYARKGIHYIQIGGLGLFTLGDANPAKLPVPRLTGDVVLEIEAKKSGDMGRETSKAAFRVHARLQPGGTSPYTLDSVDSIKALLKAAGVAKRVKPRSG